MILADTSIWIEYLKGNHPIADRMSSLLIKSEILAVECVFAELMQGAKNRREREIIEGFWRNLPREDHKDLWLEAGRFAGEDKLLSKGVGLIDAVILYAARKSGCLVWTLDKKLLNMLSPPVVYYP